MTGDVREPKKRSLLSLIADVPSLLGDLVRNEIELLKQELAAKIKHAGIGLGLLAGAGAFAFFTIGVLTAAAILGLAVALPAWAAALIVGGALLLITLILVLTGVGQLKRATPKPAETITSVKKDVNAIKGIGKRAQR
jgi:predicted phage tail protein